jgi:hypothetical protein
VRAHQNIDLPIGHTFGCQGNLFGRLGSGIGQGLAEQIPKEIEQYQLKSGLKDFSENSQGLDPMQQLAKIASVRGVTPQMIQSFSELAKQQNTKNAYARTGPTEGKPAPRSSPKLDVDFANMNNRRGPIGSQEEPKQLPRGEIASGGRSPNVPADEFNQPQVVNENPLDKKYEARLPWTPQERNDRRSQYMQQGFTPEQAAGLQQDDESRDLTEPTVYQQRYQDLQTRNKEAKAELTSQLEKKLQKTGTNVYKDITGEMLNNIERGMARDLRLDPTASVESVANDWTNRALDLAKAKSAMNTLAKDTGIGTFFTGDKTLKKLNEYADIFKKSGNSEELYNILQKGKSTKDKDGNEVDGPGFYMSPQGAASIAYPRSANVKKYLASYKVSGFSSIENQEKKARKAAAEIENLIDRDDSVLAIARDLKEKDPFFDEQSFFDQLSADKDDVGFSPRLRRELAEGHDDIAPSWGDLLIFPLWKRKK